ncbi:MAG: nitrilase-related carbon-nitrogen hydrolase [Rikenellaceae bacterium]
MKISLVQSSIKWLEPQLNWQRAEELIARCKGSQLFVLPEMFATGFCMDAKRNAANWRQSVEWMEQMAAKYSTTIAGSLAVEEGERYYNRLYVGGAEGVVAHYDKRHLFSFAGESECYDRGQERVVVEIEGVRILLQVCYDIRFPVAMRNRGDYDVVVCVANWPQSRRRVWDVLLRARAIENQAYVCGVNIVGDDPTTHYNGGTVAIDYRGIEVAQVDDDKDGVASVEIDLKLLELFRTRFPAMRDADEFEIKY